MYSSTEKLFTVNSHFIEEISSEYDVAELLICSMRCVCECSRHWLESGHAKRR